MLARALRHEPEKFGIELDAHGWAQVGPLVRGMSGKVEFSRAILEHIVAADPKGRYEFDAHHTRVRARQGHSVRVDVELERCDPPAALYHGTSARALGKISARGSSPWDACTSTYRPTTKPPLRLAHGTACLLCSRSTPRQWLPRAANSSSLATAYGSRGLWNRGFSTQRFQWRAARDDLRHRRPARAGGLREA